MMEVLLTIPEPHLEYAAYNEPIISLIIRPTITLETFFSKRLNFLGRIISCYPISFSRLGQHFFSFNFLLKELFERNQLCFA
jgi:hypothetical protein